MEYIRQRRPEVFGNNTKKDDVKTLMKEITSGKEFEYLKEITVDELEKIVENDLERKNINRFTW